MHYGKPAMCNKFKLCFLGGNRRGHFSWDQRTNNLVSLMLLFWISDTRTASGVDVLTFTNSNLQKKYMEEYVKLQNFSN